MIKSILLIAVISIFSCQEINGQNDSFNRITKYCSISVSERLLSFDERFNISFGKIDTLFKIKIQERIALSKIEDFNRDVDVLNYMSLFNWKVVHISNTVDRRKVIYFVKEYKKEELD
jgi:hypothetical protein